MKTRVEMIIEALRENPERTFTARELAEFFISRYPAEMEEKQKNPRYKNRNELVTQLAAEIGGSRTQAAKKKCPNIITQDKPRPRLYYWLDKPIVKSEPIAQATFAGLKIQTQSESKSDSTLTPNLSEHDLYPLLVKFLAEEMGLFCKRIDERKSRNTQGAGGNHWLHPDIVALETLDKNWSSVVRDCVRNSNDAFVRLWSFEVKKDLNKSNVRRSFFQAVSNSSWANYAYLVATGLDSAVEGELQMLSGLHGVGVLILNTQSLFDSQILIPARERNNIDWSSVNRITEENKDFESFVDQVGIYIQTGRVTKSLWNDKVSK